ncbi:MAG: hypothetical protein HKN27_13030 [Silicimonas sp.]|nr:hypothetical protein [Silicimonas sp.]
MVFRRLSPLALATLALVSPANAERLCDPQLRVWAEEFGQTPGMESLSISAKSVSEFDYVDSLYFVGFIVVRNAYRAEHGCGLSTEEQQLGDLSEAAFVCMKNDIDGSDFPDEMKGWLEHYKSLLAGEGSEEFDPQLLADCV